MENKNKENQCNIHIMPTTISDEDISILFNGIISLVRKKIELENQSKFVEICEDITELKKKLKEKTAECNRLKNEILFLKNHQN